MEISSTANWQGRWLAFHKLDQAFKNDKCRNSDTDFQRDSTFPLVSSKLKLGEKAKAHKKSDNLKSAGCYFEPCKK